MGDSSIVELRHRLSLRELVQYRSTEGADEPWDQSPAGSDASLRRFLIARKGNVDAAEEMFAAHLQWRSRAFPLRREGAVASILNERKRLLRLSTDSQGRPVIMVNFLWGYFLEDFTALDCVKASILFLEHELAAAEAAGAHEALVLCYGGPPPVEYGIAIAAILAANYPERTKCAVIYPVPPLIARSVRLFIWFLDEGTRSKVHILHKQREMLALLSLQVADLPEPCRGGLREVQKQLTPEHGKRINSLLWQGVTGGGRSEAQEVQESIIAPRSAEGTSEEESESPFSSWSESLFCCGPRPRTLARTVTNAVPRQHPACAGTITTKPVSPSYRLKLLPIFVLLLALLSMWRGC